MRRCFVCKGGTNSPSHGYAVTAPSGMGPLAWRHSFRLKCKVFGRARGSLPEGAGKTVRLCLREFQKPMKKYTQIA